MSDANALKDYVDLKIQSRDDYLIGLLLSVKLLIANLTLSNNMDAQGYISALQTSIKELENLDVSSMVLVAPKNILADLENLMEKLEQMKSQDQGENNE